MVWSRFSFRIVFLALLLTAFMAGHCLAHGDSRPQKTGILLVAFGTTVPEARAGFERVEATVKKKFPGIPVFWAYTSKIVRDKVGEEEGTELQSVAEALALMMDQDFTHIALLSLHTIPGEEYHSLVAVAKAFEGLPDGPQKVLVSYPLLGTSPDYKAAAKAILGVAPKEFGKDDALVLMGHGTHHSADVCYAALQYHLGKVRPNVFVGTVEGNPTLDDVLAELKARKPKTVYVMPFMSVAGDHARNDMAGDEPDSWKSVLEKAGYNVVPVLRGTSEYQVFVDLWVEHLASALSHFE